MAAKAKPKVKAKVKAKTKPKIKSAASKNLKQSVTFKASPHDVYEALMDSKKHTSFCGSPAKISRKIGGKFSAYDNYITGVNLELVADKKIAQSWKGSDWKAGEESTVIFELEPVASGTRLKLTHLNVPAKEFKGVQDGWKKFYWIPMKVQLED